ncbi:GNAT family N-acetyltransferase [Paenibacillus gansuensis]|uniref:GNAT family N-acetyltransferase n=1 Tax=Paenibacillus gansuensis TaxID=306542 RepID=A0ABW5PFL1_9BACL
MSNIVPEGNGFVMKQDGSIVAEVTYKPHGDGVLILDHTYVSPELRGQNIAQQLVLKVVEHARQTGNKIIPACSYAHAQFRRHQEYRDVWANPDA